MPNADMDMEEKKNKLLYDDWKACDIFIIFIDFFICFMKNFF